MSFSLGVVIVDECENVICVEVVNTSDMNSFPLRLESWVFCVDGGNDIGRVGDLYS